VIIASLLLGGGTRGGFLRDAVLQLLAIPLLLVALWRLLEISLTQEARLAIWFCLAIVAIPIIQLIPLPPWLWTALPGREVSIETFDILGREPPWMPISVSPHETWLSALSLIPPLGIFLATILVGYRQRRLLSLIILAIGVASVFIGLVQVAQGPNSSLRFFDFTSETEAIGFFANRNHFAALLYALTLFGAAWAIHVAATSGIKLHPKDYDAASIVAMIGVVTLLVILLAGQAMARSRAGLGLTIVALLGAFALGASDRRVESGVTATRMLFFASVLAVIFSAQYALYRIMERFVVDPLHDARLPFARNTIEAAIAYLPLGSGLGTFVPVYATFEKPADVFPDTYANHAHNDVLELWLNTGIVGLALMGMFIAWLVLRSVSIWRRAPAGARELDWSLARAATMVVALLIAHSFVDYPLRTGAMMAIMAFACGLLIEPPVEERGSEGWELPDSRKASHRRQGTRRTSSTSTVSRMTPSMPRSSEKSSDSSSLSSAERWGTEIDWPEEWSDSPGTCSPREGDEHSGRRKRSDDE
jgi:O-antigen ligase